MLTVTRPCRADLVVRVAGALDAETVPDTTRAISLAIAKAESRVFVDLSETDFVDSAGISMLIGIRAQARGRRIPLVLLRPSTAVLLLLEMTNVAELFTIAR